MSDVIVDSSVLAKCVLREEDSRQAERLFADMMAARDRVHALDLALVEVVNAIWKRYHREMISLAEARRYLQYLLASPIQIHPSDRLLTPAFEIAAKHDCAIYDALFVAVVGDLQLRGVTADEPLWRAVKTDFPTIVLLKDWRP
jgi:predicted nucleic acid-binding protein